MRLRDHSQQCKHGWFVEHDSEETGHCFGGLEVDLVNVGTLTWANGPDYIVYRIADERDDD